VLKFCASTICKPILKLFNLSISSSVFPTIWKDSFIIPLNKKGARADGQNYRGISKLSSIPNISKAFDSLFKLNQLGSPCNLLTWISSYLNGRTQRVIFKNAASKLTYVTSGVLSLLTIFHLS